MHKDVYHSWKDTGDHRTVQKAEWSNVSSKHNRIHLYCDNNKAMEQDTKSWSKQNSCDRQNDILSQDILRNFYIKETKYL